MSDVKSCKSKLNKSPFFCYKNRPLVRVKDEIYYGNMTDDCVVKIKVKSTKKVKDLNVCFEALVQLIDTDPEAPASERIVKVSQKNGLYQALDISCAWLDKYASSQEKVI